MGKIQDNQYNFVLALFMKIKVVVYLLEFLKKPIFKKFL